MLSEKPTNILEWRMSEGNYRLCQLWECLDEAGVIRGIWKIVPFNTEDPVPGGTCTNGFDKVKDFEEDMRT